MSNPQKNTPAEGTPAGASSATDQQKDEFVMDDMAKKPANGKAEDAAPADIGAELEPTETVPDPMDPARWRLDQTLTEGIATTKLLTKIPVRKPEQQEFFRVHPSEVYRLNAALILVKADREFYLVAPEVAPHAMDVAKAYTLYTVINRQGVVSLWPVRLPDGSRTDDWLASSHIAADEAMRSWVNIKANMALGAYEVTLATAEIPEPEWPEHPFARLLSIAFRDRMVTEIDHIVILTLRGQK